MSDRTKAREFAHRFATLAIDARHTGDTIAYCELYRQAQELYESIVAAKHDFDTAEMQVHDLLWELNIIPVDGDPLYGLWMENSPWRGTKPTDWIKCRDLQVGHVIETEARNRVLILCCSEDTKNS